MVAGRAVGMRLSRLLDLKRARAIRRTDAKRMVTRNHRPVIAPQHPRQWAERWGPQAGRVPRAAVEVQLDRANATVAGPGDPADRHPPCNELIPRHAVDDRQNVRPRLLAPAAVDPVARAIVI